jgi:tetratricopeptide (TPR) repeat protein
VLGRFALVVVVILGLARGAEAGDRPAAERFKKQGDVALKAGKRDLALSAYERAIAADDSYLAAYDAATPFWLEAQRFSEAVARLEVAVAREPGYALGWYHLAYASRRRNDYPRAVAAYLKFLELRPKEVDPYFGLGMTYMAMGERGKARAALETYVQRERRADRKVYRDRALATIAELDRAPVLGSEPSSGVVRRVAPLPAPSPAQRAEARRWVEMGDASLRAKKPADAVKAFERAVAANPGYAGAHYRLGAARAARGDLAGAITAWEGALLADPTHAEARRQIEGARRKLVRPPVDPQAVVARARDLLAEGRWQSALPLLDGLLADPRHARHAAALGLRAEAHLLAGNGNAAVADYLLVLAAAPDDRAAYVGLARAYDLLGDAQRAAWFRAQGERR